MATSTPAGSYQDRLHQWEAPAEFQSSCLARFHHQCHQKHLNVVGQRPQAAWPFLPTSGPPSLPGTLILWAAPFRDPALVHPRALVVGNGRRGRGRCSCMRPSRTAKDLLGIGAGAHGNLLEHINAMSAHHHCPDWRRRRLTGCCGSSSAPWRTVANLGIVHREGTTWAHKPSA